MPCLLIVFVFLFSTWRWQWAAWLSVCEYMHGRWVRISNTEAQRWRLCGWKRGRWKALNIKLELPEKKMMPQLIVREPISPEAAVRIPISWLLCSQQRAPADAAPVCFFQQSSRMWASLSHVVRMGKARLRTGWLAQGWPGRGCTWPWGEAACLESPCPSWHTTLFLVTCCLPVSAWRSHWGRSPSWHSWGWVEASGEEEEENEIDPLDLSQLDLRAEEQPCLWKRRPAAKFSHLCLHVSRKGLYLSQST